MDIYCPACGKKGRLDDAKIPDNGTFARCPGCRKRLWLHKMDGVSLAEEPAASAPQKDPQKEQQTAGTPPPSEPPTPPEAPTPPDPPPPPATPPEPAPPADPVTPGPAEHQQTAPPPPSPAPAAGFEVSPLAAPQPQPPSGVADQGVPCSLCHNLFPDSEIAAFGETKVCASCKPRYVQMMRTGVSAPGAFVYGGFWIRVVAKIIDTIILGITQMIFIVPLFIYVFRSAGSSDTPGPEFFAAFATANIFINLISVALGAAYTTFFLGRYQATPGKMAFGMKVVAPDGGQISYWRALGRHFAEMISAFMLFIGYIMAAFDSQKRTLHDRICDTRVIRN